MSHTNIKHNDAVELPASVIAEIISEIPNTNKDIRNLHAVTKTLGSNNNPMVKLMLLDTEAVIIGTAQVKRNKYNGDYYSWLCLFNKMVRRCT